ncbi:MAG: hypothetical protein ACYTEZ_19215 [Planctomycetota bacterium]
MKRGLWIVGAVVVAGAVLWLAGRAPPRHFLEDLCGRFHEERKREESWVRRETAILEKSRRDGVDTAAELQAVRARFERYLAEPRRHDVRGWEILLVPAGATPPPAGEGFARAGGFDPSGPLDRANLKGEMEFWLAPRGALARAVHALGLSP